MRIEKNKMYIETIEVSGWKGALKGMRNPMDSWHLSDTIYDSNNFPKIGEKDMKLAQNLIRAGNEHMKFMRMIHVQADLNMPRYFWSEIDTYHYNTKNSCSTMHKLLNNKKEITIEYFVTCDEDIDDIVRTIEKLNRLRQEYLLTKNDRLLLRAKRILHEGFLQLRTFDTNYAELRTMYHQRKKHRLVEEWQDIFCKWVESLPYAYELIIS